MSTVERALRDFLASRPPGVGDAIAGGIAVSARTEPRFTRGLDLAVAVPSDSEAEAYVLHEPATALERLFAASGIEAEVVAVAEPIEIGAGVVANGLRDRGGG